jgi:hypothetical protein
MSTTDNEWAVAEFLDEKGALTLLRIRYIDPIPDLSEELKIIWEYEFDAKTGLPNEEALSRMDECEGLLTEFGPEKRTCRIVAIITGEGIRQWILYSSGCRRICTIRERFVSTCSSVPYRHRA